MTGNTMAGDRLGDFTQTLDGLELGRLRSRPGAKWHCTPPHVLPAWVADMDYPVAEPVLSAMHAVLEAGDLGYPDWPEAVSPLRQAFSDRMAARFGWRPEAGEVREFANVTQAVQAVLHLATEPGDAVAMHTPAFRPLVAGLATAGRRLLPIPMRDDGSRWGFDPDRLGRDIAASGCRVLLLVNPHNPTGRSLRRSELSALAEVAERFDLLVISDEVHADLTFAPREHLPFAALGPAAAARTVTVTSASKAFNLAGLRTAVCHVGPPGVRAALARVPAELFGAVNILGAVATLAAWTAGDEWLAATLRYLEGNRVLVADALRDVPGVTVRLPEATYLAWLDLSQLGWGPDPAARLREEAGVLLSSGPDFNPGGDGFARLNFAGSRAVLGQILERIADAAGRG